MPDLAPPECFADGAIQSRLRNKWLHEQGLDYLEVDLEKQAYHWTQNAIPASLCLFAIESPTPEMREKGYGHFVVGRLRESADAVDYVVVHDPLEPLEGETRNYKVTAVGFFVPLNPCTS